MTRYAVPIGLLLLSTVACRSGWGPPSSAHGCVRDDAGVPVIARAAVPDSALLRQKAAALEVFVDTAGTYWKAPVPFRTARIEVNGRQRVRADSLGHATVTDLPSGKARLQISRSDAMMAQGPVTLRTGYRDTLRITLAPFIVCATVSH